MGKQEKASEVVDPFRKLADELLWRDAIESRSAIQGSERVEIFRGKDFYTYFKNNPDKIGEVLPHVKGKKIEDQIAELGATFQKKRYFHRSERLYKKPHPRRKVLTKWPRKVFFSQDDQRFVEGSFYTWKHQRPPTPWVYVGGWMLVLLTIGCCLFPLAPYWCKLVVFYTSLSILFFIFGIIAVRAIVYAMIWALVGKYIWIIPNLFADNVPITEIFSPWYAEEQDKHGKPYKTPHWTSRLGVIVVLLSTTVALYRNTPEKGYGAKMKRTSDDILDFLVQHVSIGGKDTEKSNDSNDQSFDNDHSEL